MSRRGGESNKAHAAVRSKETQSIAASFRKLDLDKPDSKPYDLGSPVSPLGAPRGSSVLANPSSSSSSSGSAGGTSRRTPFPDRSHSGELSVGTGGEIAGSCPPKAVRPGHRRSGSGPISSGSSASSPASNVLPLGNICPHGKIGKIGMISKSSARSDVLGTGRANYGHGSIVRGAGRSGGDAGTDMVRRAMASSDVEEVNRFGKELFEKGQFGEALKLYDRAVAMQPGNPACRSNKAATLLAIGRFSEAVHEWEAALKVDPGYSRARQQLASLYLRLGFVEDARKHLSWTGELSDPMELQKLQVIETQLRICSGARKTGDWNALLKESAHTISAGADLAVQLITSRAEAFLRLHRLVEAENALSSAFRLEASVPPNSVSRFCSMTWYCYLYVVRAQVEMALGRFESAESSAEKARGVDPQNKEVAIVLNNIKFAMRARARGNELFNSGKFADACFAYGEGLKFDPCNCVLYCNRAACHSKLGQWQKSIEDCNEALKIQPNYTKALLRRAASYERLERWTEAVQDYEALKRFLPYDKNISESLFNAQIALKSSRGEEVSNETFSGVVEEIVGVQQFRAAISLPGLTVIYFMATQHQQCLQMSPFVNTLSRKYPTIHFHKVNTFKCEGIAELENVQTLPTFKFYKNGIMIQELPCPSQQVLDYSLRHYIL